MQGSGWLFRGLDLFVDPRDRLALIGRNGAGKTTLLRLLAGRLEADEGRRVIVPGTRVVVMSPMVTATRSPPGFAAIRDAIARLSSMPATSRPREASGAAIRPVPTASSSTAPSPASSARTSTAGSITAGSLAPPGPS